MNARHYALALPHPDVLRDRCRAVATLEAILSPEQEWRHHSFNAAWSDHEEMASGHNGSGDDWSIVFGPDGVFIRGFDHESPMSPAGNGGELWPGLLDGLPDVFRKQVREPAFLLGDTRPRWRPARRRARLRATFVLWRTDDDTAWQTGEGITFPAVPHLTPDGTDQLQILCAEGTAAFIAFATDYYELDRLDPAAVEHVYALRPLTTAVIAALNPELTVDDLAHDVAEIGYPTG
ncbi:hypothetical protein AB0J72_45770 [Dactylosporangium sp. NPDC049742]|uniref:hypothetical protein n=1 Tax=Dactylosporangium sp. NPDC049742 TaxID=3154737 RepID=UPI0034480BF5